MLLMANPDSIDPSAVEGLIDVKRRINAVTRSLANSTGKFQPKYEEINHPKWGTTEPEIPMLPVSSRGILFDQIAVNYLQFPNHF